MHLIETIMLYVKSSNIKYHHKFDYITYNES